jgi:hypothetical protein
MTLALSEVYDQATKSWPELAKWRCALRPAADIRMAPPCVCWGPRLCANASSRCNVRFGSILLQKSAIAMVRLRRRFSGTVFLSRRV